MIMSTSTDISEIADGIYRLSTFVLDIAPPAGFTFNQFLVLGDEPLLFHTGLRRMFPLTREAVGRVVPVERLRWLAFGHYEADECGAMNEWIAVAPQAQVAHGATGCLVSLNDMANLNPRTLALMHGPSFAGEGRAALLALADDYDRRASHAVRT